MGVKASSRHPLGCLKALYLTVMAGFSRSQNKNINTCARYQKCKQRWEGKDNSEIMEHKKIAGIKLSFLIV